MPAVTALSTRYRERWQLIHDQLRALIVAGEIGAGERLVEQDLAQRFGVSRGPVREAFRALETEGLVVRQAGQATFVTPIGASDADEIFSLRIVVEPLAARRAMQNNPAKLERLLKVHLDTMSAAMDRGDEAGRIDTDLAFHGAFFDLAAHERLAALWRSFRNPLRLLMNVSGTYVAPPGPDLHDHATIWRHVRDRDPDACASTLRHHLEKADAALEKHFTEQDVDGD